MEAPSSTTPTSRSWCRPPPCSRTLTSTSRWSRSASQTLVMECKPGIGFYVTEGGNKCQTVRGRQNFQRPNGHGGVCEERRRVRSRRKARRVDCGYSGLCLRGLRIWDVQRPHRRLHHLRAVFGDLLRGRQGAWYRFPRHGCRMHRLRHGEIPKREQRRSPPQVHAAQRPGVPSRAGRAGWDRREGRRLRHLPSGQNHSCDWRGVPPPEGTHSLRSRPRDLRGGGECRAYLPFTFKDHHGSGKCVPHFRGPCICDIQPTPEG